MPKTDIDYSNTIIYKITCKNQTITDVYVGHTTNFVQRKHAHKQSCKNNTSPNHNCKLYEVIRANGGWDNWKMEIINFFNCADHYDARKKEQEYFIALKATLNSIEPFPKPKNILKNDLEKNNITISLSDTEKIGCKKVAEKYSCSYCNYFTSRKSSINKHLLSSKHLKRTILTGIEHKSCTDYKCKNCNKVYKVRNSLWYHSQKCIIDTKKDDNLKLYDENNITDLLATLIKNNNYLQKQILDICKK